MLRLVSYAYMPSPLPRQVQWSLFARASPLSAAFPCVTVRSAPAITFSGPAQRSLMLRPARSPSHQRDPLHRKLRRLGYPRRRFDCYRWSEPVPGREFHPLKSSAFHGALSQQLCWLQPPIGVLAYIGLMVRNRGRVKVAERAALPRSHRLECLICRS